MPKLARDRRTTPVYCIVTGVGKAWEAWVLKAMDCRGRWLKVREDRIRKVIRKHPGTAITRAVVEWRKTGWRKCQRCGHRWKPRKVESNRCSGCHSPWRYNLRHPLGRQQFALKRAAKYAAREEARLAGLARDEGGTNETLGRLAPDGGGGPDDPGDQGLVVSDEAREA